MMSRGLSSTAVQVVAYGVLVSLVSAALLRNARFLAMKRAG